MKNKKDLILMTTLFSIAILITISYNYINHTNNKEEEPIIQNKNVSNGINEAIQLCDRVCNNKYVCNKSSCVYIMLYQINKGFLKLENGRITR